MVFRFLPLGTTVFMAKATLEVPSCGSYIFKLSHRRQHFDQHSRHININSSNLPFPPLIFRASFSYCSPNQSIKCNTHKWFCSLGNRLNQPTNQPTISSSSSLSTGAKIGIAIGAIAGALFLPRSAGSLQQIVTQAPVTRIRTLISRSNTTHMRVTKRSPAHRKSNALYWARGTHKRL